jgi:hypothetical protein
MKRSALDDLIRAERRAPPHPSVARAKSTWKRIEKDLGVAAAPLPFDVTPSSVAPVAGTAAKASLLGSVGAKVTLAVVVASTAGVAAVSLPTSWNGRDTTEPPSRAVADSASAQRHDAVEHPRRPTPELTLEPAPSTNDAAEQTEPATSQRSLQPATRARRPAQRGAVAPEGIGREVDLIKRAGQALSAGHHGDALRLLDQHAREFPQGAMLEDRSALRVLALCAAGRLGEGQRAKTEFLARWSHSVHAERLEDGCSTADGE